MSMPEFPKPDTLLTQDEALSSILTSIAMEELALSHILNAEGEKIQHVIKHSCNDIQKIIEVNESVSSLIERIIDLQLILKNKMRLALDFLPSKPDKSCTPPPPCCCCECCCK